MNLRNAVLAAGVAIATVPAAIGQAAQYPQMAPLSTYMSSGGADQEVALAKSAAPPEIADKATVMVLGSGGYTTVINGTNDFTCLVERSWAKPTDDPEFYNPKMRAPTCFNSSAMKAEPLYFLKTKMVLAGQSRAEIHTAVAGWVNSQKAPVEPGAMCYMMSKQQYTSDRDRNWHPHVMIFMPGDAAHSWGSDTNDSPIFSSNVPEQRMTIFMFVVANWSDGTPGPSM